MYRDESSVTVSINCLKYKMDLVVQAKRLVYHALSQISSAIFKGLFSGP